VGVKRPEREAVHSPSSNADVNECVELYLHSPSTPSCRKKHWDNFKSRDSLVRIALGYGMNDPDSRVLFPAGGGGGSEFFSSPPRPERLWGPPSVISNGTRVSFPGGKAASLFLQFFSL
jgi:hypothetical protein